MVHMGFPADPVEESTILNSVRYVARHPHHRN